MPNCKSWAKSVRDILQSLGFYEVWLFQTVGDIDIFVCELKQRLQDVYVQNWFSEINNSSRAKSYVLFANFKLQPYLCDVNIVKFRKALTRLRLSSHRLEIEAGRWHKPESIPVNERKCQICHVLEDEFHFLLECSLYNDLRKQYISKYYWNRPNIPKFVELIASTSKSTCRKLSMYVHKAFEIRNTFVYI